MRKERDFFGAMFDGDELMAYVERMGCQRTWGDELTLRAAADCFGCTIHLVTSTESNWYLRYEPQTGTPRKNLFLTYVYPIHYDAVSPMANSGEVARPKPKSPYSPAAKAPSPSKAPKQVAPRPRSLTPKRTSSPARGTQARPSLQPSTPGKPGGPAKM
ncbi:hypothetical protein AB1Y20_012277 [Prymnesium parvum]|uniref:OTU domain-containing protein n=1 Tax=Prymnesium parvum TaxID=97485 RepID=A0AB34IQ53_PRYPA